MPEPEVTSSLPRARAAGPDPRSPRDRKSLWAAHAQRAARLGKPFERRRFSAGERASIRAPSGPAPQLSPFRACGVLNPTLGFHFASVDRVRLTKFTDLSLRAVMCLAVAEDEPTPTTREVAAAIGMPHTHTAKAISRLQHLGVVEARRGRGGGLGLTAFGQMATVGWLVRSLEGKGEVVVCEGENPCPLRAVCLFRVALRRAQERFYAELDQFTVADLVAAPTGLVLLGQTGRQPG